MERKGPKSCGDFCPKSRLLSVFWLPKSGSRTVYQVVVKPRLHFSKLILFPAGSAKLKRLPGILQARGWSCYEQMSYHHFNLTLLSPLLLSILSNAAALHILMAFSQLWTKDGTSGGRRKTRQAQWAQIHTERSHQIRKPMHFLPCLHCPTSQTQCENPFLTLLMLALVMRMWFIGCKRFVKKRNLALVSLTLWAFTDMISSNTLILHILCLHPPGASDHYLK